MLASIHLAAEGDIASRQSHRTERSDSGQDAASILTSIGTQFGNRTWTGSPSLDCPRIIENPRRSIERRSPRCDPLTVASNSPGVAVLFNIHVPTLAMGTKCIGDRGRSTATLTGSKSGTFD